MYLGLFDYDGENKTDDFIGRVVLDIAQLPDYSKIIDVTLPLRAYSRVYTKTKLGSIRVRLQLHWKEGAQRAALLSYFPRNLKFVKKRKKAWPNDPVTVACPDAKSFQNIALTIYGTVRMSLMLSSNNIFLHIVTHLLVRTFYICCT